MHKLLVCDDDAPTRELIAAILGADEYELIFAIDGEEALDLAREHHPDLMVLDLMMPRMDGIESCNRLKDDPELAGIPVLMLTAHADFDARAQAEEAHADGYLTKPFSPFTFRRALEHLLEVSEAKRRQET
ncbi:MAG: response regulator [Actinomycetota bacterium]